MVENGTLIFYCNLLFFLAFNETGVPESREPSIAIQIEVDIEPPLHQDQDLSEEQLHKLGLPTHHVHYWAGQPAHQADRQPSGQPAGTELLAPADIQVYTGKQKTLEKKDHS